MIGAGGHGRVVAEAAIESGAFTNVVFLDDRYPDVREVDGYAVIGQIGAIEGIYDGPQAAIVALGDNMNRVKFLDLVVKRGLTCPPILHPAASVSRNASLGDGTVVLAGAIVGIGADLGRCCIVNTGCTIDHDCILGNGVHVSPGANLAGGVCVGEYSWIGIGASVKHGIRIGSRVVIGASAAVVDDVPDGVVVAGVPAKPI